MSEEKSGSWVCRKRNALEDLTNVDRKRGVLLGNNVSVNGEKNEKGVEFVKKVRVGVENLEKENCLSKVVVDEKERDKRVCVSASSNTKGESEANELLHGNVEIGSGGDVAQNVVDALRDSCVFSDLMVTSPCNLDSLDVGVGLDSQGEQGNVQEQVDTSNEMNDENEFGDDNLNSSKGESTECFGFPESQESRSNGMERYVGLNGDGTSNLASGVDLLKACSCSFCTKAAYILSDFHYQDTKGRLSALKKSQKEANILVQGSFRGIDFEIDGEGKSDIVELQSSLTGQWRSLFLHMEDIFGRESSQLEANLFTLNDVRESCKADLEALNRKPVDKQ